MVINRDIDIETEPQNQANTEVSIETLFRDVSELKDSSYAHLLSKRQLDGVSLFVRPKEVHSFLNFFQERMCKKEGKSITLAQALKAVNNSEKLFKQFPVDFKNLKEKAVSIFCEEQWLMFDPVIGSVNNTMYCIGGRHRIIAIALVFAQLALRENILPPQQMFETYLKQTIRVDVLQIENKEILAQMIVANNDGRRVRKAEETHLEIQVLGADAVSPESAAVHALNSVDLNPKKIKELAAQYFTRKNHPRLKPQTRQVIGERMAQWVLYDARLGKRIGRKNSLMVTNINEFIYLMDMAWDILCKNIENSIVVAKNSNAISEEVIDTMIDLDARSKAKLETEAFKSLPLQYN